MRRLRLFFNLASFGVDRAIWFASGYTYAGQQGQFREVLQRLKSASVQADQFKLGELLEVGLVLGQQAIDIGVVEYQIVELNATEKQTCECVKRERKFIN